MKQKIYLGLTTRRTTQEKLAKMCATNFASAQVRIAAGAGMVHKNTNTSLGDSMVLAIATAYIQSIITIAIGELPRSKHVGVGYQNIQK